MILLKLLVCIEDVSKLIIWSGWIDVVSLTGRSSNWPSWYWKDTTCQGKEIHDLQFFTYFTPAQRFEGLKHLIVQNAQKSLFFKSVV